MSTEHWFKLFPLFPLQQPVHVHGLRCESGSDGSGGRAVCVRTFSSAEAARADIGIPRGPPPTPQHWHKWLFGSCIRSSWPADRSEQTQVTFPFRHSVCISQQWSVLSVTCRCLVCVTNGTHCRLLVLQQPEQRCTSTQGGHNRKLALLRSNMALVTSTTSVRTLQRACWAGCASERNIDR